MGASLRFYAELPPMSYSLLLLRHAKSSWSTSSLADHARPLNERGLHDGPKVGARLNELRLHPDWVWCSTAERTRQTADLVLAPQYFDFERLDYRDDLYHASGPQLFEALRAWPHEISCLMLIGHEPGLSELARLLLREGPDELPTCTCLEIQFTDEGWRAAQGTLGEHVFARSL